jgi:CO dehydrogenase/acetyl-CoA synthase gamma subunit (corrinoid Fe-S protein)
MKTKYVFLCDVSVMVNGKEVYHEQNFSRWAETKNRFLSILKWNMEKLVGKKLQWDMVLIKKLTKDPKSFNEEILSSDTFTEISKIHGKFKPA